MPTQKDIITNIALKTTNQTHKYKINIDMPKEKEKKIIFYKPYGNRKK